MSLFNYLFIILNHILISITIITILVLICYYDIVEYYYEL